nr:hypothetical protein [Proteus hauseri]
MAPPRNIPRAIYVAILFRQNVKIEKLDLSSGLLTIAIEYELSEEENDK